MTRGVRVRALGAVMLAGVLVLSGCGGDEEGGTDDVSGTRAPGPDDGTDADAVTDDAGRTGAAPTGPPTAPADIDVEAGERSASGGTSVVVDGDRAAFVLPSGGIACTVNEVTAVCEVQDLSYTPQAGHLVDDSLGDCTAQDATAIMINDGQGAWTCVEDPILPQAWVAAGGWWARANESETLKIGNNTMAVLSYGSTLTVGPVTCASSEDGVRCSSSATGRSFFVSRSSYQFG